MPRHPLAVAASAGLLALLCAACGSSAAPQAVPATAPAPPAATSAQLTPQHMAKTVTGAGGAACTYDLTWVSVAGVPAADAIGKAVSLDPKPDACTDPGDESGGYDKPSLNEGGLLSFAYLISSYAEGAPHPNNEVRTYTFDLATGKALTLDDVLTPAGRTAFVAGCKAAIDKELADADYCEPSLSAADAPFTVTRDGLVAQPMNEVPHAAQGLVADGVLVPWKALADGLKPGTKVAALAGR
jgi:hypothetical protein